MSSKVEREEVIYMATKQEFVELIGRVFADDEFRTKLQSDPVWLRWARKSDYRDIVRPKLEQAETDRVGLAQLLGLSVGSLT
jgi:hypothetical protein